MTSHIIIIVVIIINSARCIQYSESLRNCHDVCPSLWKGHAF